MIRRNLHINLWLFLLSFSPSFIKFYTKNHALWKKSYIDTLNVALKKSKLSLLFYFYMKWIFELKSKIYI